MSTVRSASIGEKDPLMQIRNLRVSLDHDGEELKVVDGVSLTIGVGERVGLVGESGCGKSMTARSILRLLPAVQIARFEGEILFEGQDLMQIDAQDLRAVRGKRIGIVFQDPMTYLNPTMRVDRQIKELLPKRMSRADKDDRVRSSLTRAGLDPGLAEKRYPHELSGGMRQRVLIAMALVAGGSLVIADEPTTALDVTVQAEILRTLKGLAVSKVASVLLITHDLAVVANFCDRVYVMYAGEIVEEGDVLSVFENPEHPYTQGLLESLPSRARVGRQFTAIPGSVPDLRALPTGCHFRPRCRFASEVCEKPPPWAPRADGGGKLCWIGHDQKGTGK